MWKINKIEIENFKFFKDSFTLMINEKNMLLYGENGSGKSSIYWSLYTLFQSVYKDPTPNHALKYFYLEHPENLRNKFSNPNDYSGIKVTFTESGREYKVEDSSVCCSTHCPGDDFMKLSSAASDFMNYKFLSAIFDFKNSQRPEIFHIFESEIFPSMVFSPSPKLVHIDGSRPDKLQDDVDYWWKYLQTQYTELPTGKNPKNILKTSPEMLRYKDLLSYFNSEIKFALHRIENATNHKLQHDFKVPASISFSYKNASIAQTTPSSDYNYTSKIEKPQITIKAKFEHETLADECRGVLHPRSFFNEAKLTCIALALRLTIAEMKMDADNTYAKVLLVDDLLISLDMSNRMVIVDYLLKLVSRYQMFIFTHDKSFYTLIKRRLTANNQHENWQFLELYAADDTITNYPVPILLPSESLLDQARCHFANCNYAACANTLRRSAELIFQRLLPHETLYPNGQEMVISLYPMIQEAKSYFELLGIDTSLLVNLDFYREYLLNPMSHGDTRTEIYRYELSNIMKDLSELYSIKRIDRIKLENCRISEPYQISMSNADAHYTATFVFLEPWPVFQYESKEYYHTDIKIRIISANYFQVTNEKVTENKIGKLYNQMCRALFKDNTDLYPNYEDVISKL